MSDSKNRPGPPPDDFSKTTPNINLPKDSFGQNPRGKSSHNFPAQPPADDWGNTVANIRPIETDENDFGKTYPPSSQKNSPAPDWGITQANIDLSQTDFGSERDNYGSSQRNASGSGQEDFGAGYGATTPYFRLPEAERAKYQNLPPTPTEKAAQERKEQSEKGGIPAWAWISGGLLSMFFFAVAVLLLVFFFILDDTGFEATVKNAPPGSSVRVNGSPWGVTDEGGSIKLPILKEGETKRIEILHPSYICQPAEVASRDGVVSPNPISAQCKQVAVQPGEDCNNIRLREFDKAERCYNQALEGLPDPFTAEDLVKALSILIINFESGKFDVPPVRQAALQKGAKFIQKLPPSVVLEIGGHTDSDGDDASNRTLSDNRASAVRNQLIKFGVRPEVLEPKGYGETQPKMTNDTEDGKFFNRRIQYSVLKK